jgi:hypothetical protein
MMVTHQPQIESARRLEVYSFGGYSAVLLGDIVSSGEISYAYMLVVLDMKTRQPCLFITSEPVDRSGSRSRKGPSHFLRLCPGRGAGVPFETLPPSSDWADAGKFSVRAVALTKEWIAKKEEPKTMATKKKTVKKAAKKTVKKAVKKVAKKKAAKKKAAKK